MSNNKNTFEFGDIVFNRKYERMYVFRDLYGRDMAIVSRFYALDDIQAFLAHAYVELECLEFVC